MTNIDRPLLHICYAPADRGWVHGRMVCELGLQAGEYHTREDDGLGELQLQAITKAVEECRFTVLVASSAVRWDKLAQFAAGLAQHAGLEDQTPRLIIIARDFMSASDVERERLSLAQRALVSLDCSDETSTVAALARLRTLLALNAPVGERPACPYPGLARFIAANRDLLFGRDRDKDNLVQRIRADQRRLLIVGPSGSGKSSLIHAAVLPELSPRDHLVQVVPRGDGLAVAVREVVNMLEIPELGAALDAYVATVQGATDAQIEEARTRLRTVPVPDLRRRVIVVDPLEEVFAEDDAASRETLFALLGGLWSMPWCTVILCMRADFYGALMVERCWHELKGCQYPVAPLDEAGLHAAIVEPATRVGVHVDAALVERLIREIDRDRASVPLPLLQVALKELWAHLRWRYLTLADYERIVNRSQRGLAAVLAVHADGVMQRLTGPGDRAVAQRILLDLVHLGEGRPHTRRRRALADLRRSSDAPEQLERVLDQLIAGRLVTTGDVANDRSREINSSSPSVEISRLGCKVDLAHDTLITGWPELAGWVAERRADLRTQRRLETRALTGGLLTSSELPEFLRWTATPAGQLLGTSDVVRGLVRRSVAARRLRWGALSAGLVVAVAIAIMFGLQAQRLRDERAKTQQLLSEAMETANVIVFEIDDELRKVAGASPIRERLLKRSRELVIRLRKLGDLPEGDKRTAMVSKMSEAQLALERGHLNEASALCREVLADAERRAATDSTNPLWQHDLSVSYEMLGDVAVSAGKLNDADTWFNKTLVVRQGLAAADPGNTDWQRDLSMSYNRLGDVAVRAGRRDDAGTWFDKSLTVRQALAAADPSNTDWQRDLAVTYERLGDVAVFTGKLDEARTRFDQALAVRKVLVAADLNNTDWQRDLSMSYNKLGDVAVRAGKLDDARTWFEQALAVAKVLAAADPSNTDWQRDLSMSFNRLGDVAVSAGKLEDARTWFDKDLAVAKVLAAADPSNTDWQRDLSVSYERLGDVAVPTGRLDDARTWFDKALAVRKALAAADPSNTDWQRDLTMSYNKLGDVAVRAGKLDDARTWFDQALAVAKALVGADPSNTDWQHNLLVSYERLGDVAVSAGKLDDARTWFDKALTVAKMLTTVDQSNTDWQNNLSASYERLGDLAVRAGKLDDAGTWFGKALTVHRMLAASDPSNANWQHNLTGSYIKLGEVAISAGKLTDARGWFDQAIAVAKVLAAADPRNTDWQRSLAVAYARLGDVAEGAGRLDDARTWLDKALAVRKALAATDSSNTDWQRDLSMSYEKLGEVAESAGKPHDARTWLDKALAVRNALAAADPSNAGWQRDLCRVLTKIALVAPDSTEAMRHLDESRRIYGRLQREGSFRGDEQFAQIGRSLDQLARVLTARRH